MLAQMSCWMSSGSRSRLKINISGRLMQYWASAALVAFINLSVNWGPPPTLHACISPSYAVTLLDPGGFCWIAISYQICSRGSTGNTGADCHRLCPQPEVSIWQTRSRSTVSTHLIAASVRLGFFFFLAASRMIWSWSGPICVRSITMLSDLSGPAGKRI